ncbi:unnamed protein product, partial [Rhizophagus irregularis]
CFLESPDSCKCWFKTANTAEVLETHGLEIKIWVNCI